MHNRFFVNRVSSRNLQLWAFENGWRWRENGTRVSYYGANVLNVRENKILYYGYEDDYTPAQYATIQDLPEILSEEGWEFRNGRSFLNGVEYKIELIK